MYLTKYALTAGVYRVEFRENGIVPMIGEWYVLSGDFGCHQYGKTIFETKEEAMAVVGKMLEKKIKQLEKTLHRYNNFEIAFHEETACQFEVNLH